MNSALQHERITRIPAPDWGSPMRHSVESGVHMVTAEAPGLFRSPPALRLLPTGIFLAAAGLFVISGAVVGAVREGLPGGVPAVLAGGGLGAIIVWLGVVAIRWGAAAAWEATELTLDSRALGIRSKSRESRILREDFRSTMVTDQFKMADELLVIAGGNRVVRVLSGRSVAELSWLAHLIESVLLDGAGGPEDDGEM